jgi:autoinducer 2-degrading protein
MFVSCVTVYVMKEKVADFIEATKENHQGALKEPGNLRFDVLQCTSDPARFLLYEAYESEAAAVAHKKTPHYLAWKAAVDPIMAKPREGVPHRVVFPDDRKMW